MSLNTAVFARRRTARGLMTLLLVFLLSGCATPKIDWSARVGGYTYDQAVIEMGPPDKRATLGDGTIVAEWITRRSYTYSTAAPYYNPYYGPSWWGMPFHSTHYVNSTPDYFLRLVFGPDGRLQSWKKFAK